MAQLAVLSPVEYEVLPSPQQWQTMLQMAEVLVRSGFLPKAIDTPQKATAVILKGRELSIPAMHSFAHINIIDGKPSCSAELQLALIARGGVTWDWLQDGTSGTASIRFHRQGFAPFVSTFTTEDAKTAGLLGKQNWQKYPAAMRCARAISNGARKIAPDLLAGMSYTPEELGAEVDEDGKVVEGRQLVEPTTRPTQRAVVSGQQVDPTTDEILQPEQEAPGSTEEADPEDQERAERSALIGEIERLEKHFGLRDEQKAAKRTKYMGTTDFDAASLDGLAEYERILSSAAGTGAQK